MSYGRRHALRVMRLQACQSVCIPSVHTQMRYHTVAHYRTRGKQGKLTVLILPPLSISFFLPPVLLVASRTRASSPRSCAVRQLKNGKRAGAKDRLILGTR